MKRIRLASLLAVLVVGFGCAPCFAAPKVFNVLEFGARGDGWTLDTLAIQKAIDEAGEQGGGARVLIPSGHTFLISTLELRANIDFHIERGAELRISTNRADYRGDGVLTAHNAANLTISGKGSFMGQALSFMTGYDEADEWWRFQEWRPKMFILTGCTNLVVKDITFGDAPEWGLHLLGCHHVLVDGIKIRNHLDVPNCDGIDPDHCTDVLIKNCDLRCGDDAVVIKTTRQDADYGPSANIRVTDCLIETQDSGLKIGTETTSDIRDIIFERCEIRTSSRGLTIQLRDEGSVSNVVFRNIKFTSRYYSDPWWGRGEAISFTAIPRTRDTKLGKIQAVHVENVRGRAENSLRVYSAERGHIENITFDDVSIEFGRWTKYQGGLFDNRPTKVYEPILMHGNPGFSLHNVAGVELRDCKVRWRGTAPDYFTYALEADGVSDLRMTGFEGKSAHPKRDDSIVVR